MTSPFDTRPVVHFALDDESDSDSAADLTTARSSPAVSQLPIPSTSSRPYSDDDASSSGQPLVALEDAAPLSPSTRAAEGFYYPPKPLKSTIPSREAAFDLDSDELDPEEVDASEPLLMEGLLQSGARRGSVDFRREGRAKELEDGEGGDPPDWLRKGAGVLGGIANMSNSILGAGIIGELGLSSVDGRKLTAFVGLPYALREAGFFVGLLLLVALGFVTDWTIRLIVLNAKMSGRKTYIDIMDACESPTARNGWLARS